MSSIAKSRPSRRSASRKSYVVEETSEEEDPGSVTPTPSNHGEDEEDEEDSEEYTPVPQKRQSRRRTTAEAPTPSTSQPPRKTRRSMTAESESSRQSASSGRQSIGSRQSESSPQSGSGQQSESSTPRVPDTKEEDDSEADYQEPESPTQNVHAARKRQSMTHPRKSRVSASPNPNKSSLPTPEPSVSPHLQPRSPRESVPPVVETVEPNENQSPKKEPEEQKSQISIINPNSTVLEKPMDIMTKSRNLDPQLEEPTGPKTRLMIQTLVLTNFKSYAGKQIVGPFHGSFSAVVGPNGSGKSNVIDALLFVFGFRASKMRQGKISALIHNSAAFPDLPYCEVEVHFQEVLDLPGEGYEVIPDSQLIISRRAFKQNSSKYYMNGKDTNFSAVTTLLRDRGIDLDHKRFLILQGEVESISQMKSKAGNEHEDGLLEYIEDIIGTSKYKTPIDEAAAELEGLNDVCVEKNNRVQHVEKEKNSLEDKKNKALAYIHDENELAQKQSALYQIYMDECADNIRVTEEAILQMQELLNLELEKHEGSESGIKELEKAYKRGMKEYESMEKEMQTLSKEMAKYDKESVKFEEKKKFLLGKQKKLEKSMQSARLAASECESLVEKHSHDIEKKTGETSQLEKEMKVEEEELGTIREGLRGKTQGLSDQVTAKQKSLEPWDEKINKKLSSVAVAQSELDILRERSNAGAVLLEEAQGKVSSIEETLATKQNDLEERKAQKSALEEEVAKLQHNLEKYSQREPEVRAHVSGARQKADEARASLASTQNRGNVLTGLMRLKESGRIDGFHGRLGNLGTIDEKYDVAISTACPALDNMVVDSVEVGQHCIDYLRKNNLGRANFILLDRLPKRDLSSIFTPESVPRLFDLVKPREPKFAPAFYSVMQNTLVAKDLEQANRIAYGARRWRVVTLDGQLIDVSGTMSGGGTRVARGGMSSKQVGDTTKEQVSKLEGDLEETERKFQAFREKQQHIEASIREKSDEIPRVETKIQKIMIEIESSNRSLTDAQRRVKELSAEHKPSKTDASQAKALEQQISSLEDDIEGLRAEKGGIEEEIQTLQNKIMEIGGVKLRSQKAKVDGLKEQISLLSEEISNAEVEKSKNEKLIAKHQKSRTSSEKELEQVADDLEKLHNDAQSQTDDASGWRQKVEEAQEVCRYTMIPDILLTSTRRLRHERAN